MTSIAFDPAALLMRHIPAVRLDKYYDLLMQENQKVNLVSRETTRADFDRMVAECLLPLDQFPTERRFDRYLDIGSGGGLPLIPFLLAGRVSSAVAAERIGKKAHALSRICRELKLPVKVLARTIEDIPAEHRFDLVTLRYVKLTELLIKSISRFLAPGARFVYYSAVPLPLKEFEIARCEFSVSPDQPDKSFSIISLKA